MYMAVLKWICFIIVFFDFVSYVVDKAKTECDSKAGRVGTFIGMSIGIAARIFVLYGTATCWLLV